MTPSMILGNCSSYWSTKSILPYMYLLNMPALCTHSCIIQNMTYKGEHLHYITHMISNTMAIILFYFFFEYFFNIFLSIKFISILCGNKICSRGMKQRGTLRPLHKLAPRQSPIQAAPLKLCK